MGNTHVVPKAVGCVVPCFIQSLLYHSTQFSSVKLLPLPTAKYRAHLNPPSFPAKEPGRAEHGTQTQSLSQNCFKFTNLSLSLWASVWCHTKHSSLSFSQIMYIVELCTCTCPIIQCTTYTIHVEPTQSLSGHMVHSYSRTPHHTRWVDWECPNLTHPLFLICL